MSWRDKLQTASFRGVKFGVSGSDVTGGRRSILFEFPARDIPYTQDLGKKAKTFSVTGFVVGSDYLGKRDNLINALDKKGSGELVHPYYGKLTVQAGEYTIRESADGGGFAEFTMAFSQSEKIQFTNIESPNGIAAGEAFVSDLFDFSLDRFIPNFDVSGISYVLDSAVGAARALNTLGKKFLAPLATVAGVLDDAGSAFNSIAVETRSLATQPIRLVNAFQSPFKKIIGGLGQLDRIGASYSRLRTGDRKIDNIRLQAIKYGLRLFRESKNVTSQISGSTTGTARISGNTRSMKMAYRVASLALAGDSLLTAPYDTLTDAKTDKTAVLDALNEMAEEIQEFQDHEELYKILIDFKIHLARFVPADGASLKNEKTFIFPSTLNSLSAVYSLYGNLESEENIILRNGVRNPAILAGFEGIKYVG